MCIKFEIIRELKVYLDYSIYNLEDKKANGHKHAAKMAKPPRACFPVFEGNELSALLDFSRILKRHQFSEDIIIVELSVFKNGLLQHRFLSKATF
ncbi:hypothetical protein GCM10027050_03890 [Psychrosphaera aestuarii]